MRLVHVCVLLSATLTAALPASAQTWGTTRIPPQVQELKNPPEPPVTDDAEIAPVPALAPAGQHSYRESQTLGDGTKDPSAKRMEETAASLIPPGGVIGLEQGPGERAHASRA